MACLGQPGRRISAGRILDKTMSNIIDADKVQEALDRAAYSACFGPPSMRAGRFDHEDLPLKKSIAQDLLRLVREHGFKLRETRDDLEIWQNPVTQKSIVVPTSGISRRNANALLIQVGLSEAI
jgi:hypothetical protein